MSKPVRIKITTKSAIEVGNFQDAKGNGFVSVRKVYRKEGETSSKDWKPTRQHVTLPIEYVKETARALRKLAEDIENAEVWTRSITPTPTATETE